MNFFAFVTDTGSASIGAVTSSAAASTVSAERFPSITTREAEFRKLRLSLMTLGVIWRMISISQTAIQAVPHEYEEASLALGATKTETIFKVTLPAAKSGILASIVLGIGRALGEAMAVMMVAGNVANMPSLFKSVRFLTTAVASEMSYSSGLQRQALFSIALVLFIFILLINIILNFVVKRERK